MGAVVTASGLWFPGQKLISIPKPKLYTGWDLARNGDKPVGLVVKIENGTMTVIRVIEDAHPSIVPKVSGVYVGDILTYS